MAVKRLGRDLNALHVDPLPGISAEPSSQDMHLWHFNLRGARGECNGLAVHGLMRFPGSYPSQPPVVRLCSLFPHPNVIETDEGYMVCMDLLEANASRPYSGWSSSYCVGSLLLQLQSTLFDERATIGDVTRALTAAQQHVCRCGHNGGQPKPPFPTLEMLQAQRCTVVTRVAPSILRPRGKLLAQKVRTDQTSTKACGPLECSSLRTIENKEDLTGATTREAEEDKWCEVRRQRGSRKKIDTLETASTAPSESSLGLDSWGLRKRIEAELSAAQSRNNRRSQKRLERRLKEMPKVLLCGSISEIDAAWEVVSAPPEHDRSGRLDGPGSALQQVSCRLLIEVLALLEPEDAVHISMCGRFFASLGEDGLLWKHMFCQRYPCSELNAQSIAGWKHCFLLEVNHVEADLICFHTKASFKEAVLGIPVDFSVNPRTQRIDYISSTMDLMSSEAIDRGVRLTQWNEAFKTWIPVFLTQDHFQRAKLRFERSMVILSPHWGTSRFLPFMVLEVIPKIMNTMVVLLSDKGLEVTDRALNGYFLMWRLLLASVEEYSLQAEVARRLAAFRVPENRTKAKVPSIGDFLPLLSVSGTAALSWDALAQPVIEETFDRNALWACRDHPEFANSSRNTKGTGADMDRLQKHFTSTKVSKRLLMFHVLFLRSVENQTMDFLFGRPPVHIRQSFKQGVQSILAVETWPSFFSACRRPCPNPSALTDIVKQAVKNSRHKKYHTDKTDFSRIQASGTSHILKKGESYKVSDSVRRVRLELGSDSAMILCGACLAYEDLTCSEVVCYSDRTAYKGALKHSGDQQIDGKSQHIMDVDLARLPSSVNRLFFTLCACGADNLSAFKKPAIALQDADGAQLCSYTIDQAGQAPTVVMAGVERCGGSWQVTALGKHSAVGCCGNYSQVKRDIATIKM